ncbi:MAG: restriction endonuclease subunit S [Candidatus Delongbacteria bacterium]|nr:restriction endonuclease subunit S [Candidatus Delongbacteria bacterium]MBN2836177.1 restriction endonuclease subunit S [Candidatus Delongbacteria bacterium]
MNKLNKNAQILFVNYSKMDNWSIRYLKNHNFNYDEKYKLYKIGDFLTRNKEIIEIEDENEYKRVTIKLYNKGVFIRDTEFGKNIGVKKQYKVKEGQFILSKIDARNGAFGIIPSELEGAITTADFLSYDINISKINPKFLSLLTTTKEFLNYCQNSSSGTTGRQRINEKLFLDITIPIPSMEKQNIIVKKFQEKMNLAISQEKEAEELEKSIECFLIQELEISKTIIKDRIKGLQFQDYKNIERWDIWNEESELKSKKYKNIKIKNGIERIKSKINKLKTKDYELNGKIPIISQEKEFISGYTNKEITPISYKDLPLIIYGDHSQTKKYVDFEFVCGADGVKLLKPKKIFNIMYFYYYLYIVNFNKSQKYTRHFKYLAETFIPIPPTEIQNYIVSTICEKEKKIKELKEQAELNRKTSIEEFEKEIFKNED